VRKGQRYQHGTAITRAVDANPLVRAQRQRFHWFCTRCTWQTALTYEKESRKEDERGRDSIEKARSSPACELTARQHEAYRFRSARCAYGLDFTVSGIKDAKCWYFPLDIGTDGQDGTNLIQRRIYGLVAYLLARAIDDTRLIAMRTTEPISASTNSQTDFWPSTIVSRASLARVREKLKERVFALCFLSAESAKRARWFPSAVSMTRVSSPNFRARIRKGTQTAESRTSFARSCRRDFIARNITSRCDVHVIRTRMCARITRAYARAIVTLQNDRLLPQSYYR